MPGLNASNWWKGSFPTWIVFGLFSIISFTITRYLNRTETRWEHTQTQLGTFVTSSQFDVYQRQHKEFADEVLRRMDSTLSDINRRLTRMEDRQERQINGLNKKSNE